MRPAIDLMRLRAGLRRLARGGLATARRHPARLRCAVGVPVFAVGGVFTSVGLMTLTPVPALAGMLTMAVGYLALPRT